MTLPVPRHDVGSAAVAPAEEDAEARREAEAEEARARLRRGRVVTAVVAGVLVLAVGVVALLGGFERRRDQVTPVAVGSTITTGPFVITLDRGTVQRRTGDGVWEVRLSGSARTTGTTSVSPSSGVDPFVFAKDPGTGEVVKPYSVRLGDPDQLFRPESLTPGLPPVPWTVVFRFPRRPGTPLTVVVLDLDYGTKYIFGDEEGWEAQSSGHRSELSLASLPDTKY